MKKITCTPYEIETKDVNNKTEVRLWCLGYYENAPKIQHTFLFRVNDFKTHLFAEILGNNNINLLQTMRTKNKLVKSLENFIPNHKNLNIVINRSAISNRIPIYYYQDNNKKKYVKLYFSSFKGKRSFYSQYHDTKKKFTDYKTNSLISYKFNCYHYDIKEEWIFFKDINMRPAQSFSLETYKEIPEDEQISKDHIHEYFISKRHINPLPLDDLYLGSPRILSYDLECLSKDGVTFPQYYREDDVIFLITCYINNYGDPDEKGRKVAIHLGDLRGMKFNDIDVIECKTEEDVLQGFLDLIEQEKIHIIVGFNNLAFDNAYINSRREVLMKKYNSFGHLKNESPFMSSMSWSSSAYQNVEINYLHSSGMINCDMLTEIRRNFKFRKYTLNEVSKNILGETKVDISIAEMFKVRNLYEDGVWDQYVQDLTRKSIEYGTQDAVLPLKLFYKCGYFGSYIQMSNVNRIRIPQLYTNGQTIRSKSNIYNYAMEHDFILTKQPPCSIKKFPGAQVFKPNVGLHDLVLCLDFNSLYPSIMCAHNLCITTFIHQNDWDLYTEGEYNAFHPPGFGEIRFIDKKKFVGVFPKIIKELLTSRKETRKKKYKIDQELEKEEEKEDKDPSYIQDLKTKSLLLESLQLAIKVSNNSIYGGLGSGFGGEDNMFKNAKNYLEHEGEDDLDDDMGYYKKYYTKKENKVSISMKEVSLVVTFIGKNLILDTMKQATEDFPYMEIYGDTDSIMVKPTDPNTDIFKAIEEGKVMEKAINERLAPLESLTIELEKIMRMITVTPKRYAYLLYNLKNGKLDPLEKINTKGLLSTRRDNSIWQQEIFLKVICLIMDGHKEDEIKRDIIGEMYKFVNNEVEFKKLTISASCRDEYASDGNPLAIYKEYMKNRGTPLKAGERFEYMMVDLGDEFNEKTDKIGKLIRGFEEFEESQETDKPYKLYHKYYMDKKLKKGVDQVFGIVFGPKKEELEKELSDFLLENKPLKNFEISEINEKTDKKGITKISESTIVSKIENTYIEYDKNKFKKIFVDFNEKKYNGCKKEEIQEVEYNKLKEEVYNKAKNSNKIYRTKKIVDKTEYKVYSFKNMVFKEKPKVLIDDIVKTYDKHGREVFLEMCEAILGK